MSSNLKNNKIPVPSETLAHMIVLKMLKSNMKTLHKYDTHYSDVYVIVYTFNDELEIKVKSFKSLPKQIDEVWFNKKELYFSTEEISSIILPGLEKAKENDKIKKSIENENIRQNEALD